MLTSGDTQQTEEKQQTEVGKTTSRQDVQSIRSSSQRSSSRTTMRPVIQTSGLLDLKVDVKIVLSAIWVSMMFVFAYVDIFGYWRADVINGALDGKVPVSDFEINQTFLTIITLYIIIPSLMVVFSLVAPARINRPVNIVGSLIYAVTIIASMVGESWTYYLLGSVVEVFLLLNLARVAWTWPRLSTPRSSGRHA
jgi:Family of unknown function (DUF6326)